MGSSLHDSEPGRILVESRANLPLRVWGRIADDSARKPHLSIPTTPFWPFTGICPVNRLHPQATNTVELALEIFILWMDQVTFGTGCAACWFCSEVSVYFVPSLSNECSRRAPTCVKPGGSFVTLGLKGEAHERLPS
jgi:hypothetical protein